MSPRVRALFWALLLGYTALHLGYSILRYSVFTGISSGDFNHVYQEAKAWPSENLHPHPAFYYATVLILDRLVGGWQNLIYFFYFIQFLIFPLAILFLVKAAWSGPGPPPWTAYALAAALTVNFQPFLETLSLHKVEGIEFFLICAALLAFRRGRDRLSGGLLMLAANLKYMPALLLVHFGIKREWKVLQGALIGAAAVLAILLPVFGTTLLSSGFPEQAVGLFIGHRHEGNVAAASVEMQTLSGTVNRWLARPAGGTPFMHYIQVGSYMPVPDPALAYGVAGGLKLLAVAGWLFWLRRRWGAGERQRRWAAHLLEISVSMVMIFVIAQASRVHYSVLALPGFCVVGLLLVQGGRLFSLGEKALFWLAYALTGMLIPGGLLNRLPPDPAWGQMHSWRYLWYSLPFWGLVLLALCAVRMHRRALQER